MVELDMQRSFIMVCRNCGFPTVLDKIASMLGEDQVPVLLKWDKFVRKYNLYTS